jgi:uncharacterized protein involved in outer membrane biogenesis
MRKYLFLLLIPLASVAAQHCDRLSLLETQRTGARTNGLIGMRPGLKIAAVVLAGIATLLALALLLLANLDWNRAKPWLSEKVSAATERSFSIDGDLSLRWQRPAQEHGWRRWVPWPHLRARDVMLGNPAWATSGPVMARVQQIDFTLNPLALLRKTIRVESLILTEPRLTLEQDSKGRNNWTFPAKESKSAWRFVLQDLAMTQGTIRYIDPAKRADIVARVDTLDDGGVGWKLNGIFNDEKLSGGGRSGTLLSLQAKGVRYPVEAMLKVGETTIAAKGTLTDPAHPSAVDVQLDILGASMADLFPLSGVLLPETPKFSTGGRLVGTLGRGKLRLRYEKFKGRVGSSDIGGTLEYIQQNPRPLLRGEVVSNRLRINDLGPLVGVGGGKRKQKSGTPRQPPGKVLPVAPFRTERWGRMDVDVQFTGREIIHGDTLPLDNMHASVRMNNGVLSLAPLDFGIAGGKLATELSIDGRSNPGKATMKIAARELKLRQLFPAVEAMRASLGEMHGDAQLSATGNSIAALLASSNGEVKALISEGTVSKFILEAIGLNLGSVVVSKLFGDRQVQLNCMAADFGVTNGLMQARTFVFDTSDATIRVDGSIDLGREVLDLRIHPQSKGIRIISLRSPLYIRGTFKNPDVGVDKGIVALKAGAAVALGTVASPFAGLLALINPGAGEDSPCAVLLAQAQQKPLAPPPGKSPARSASTPK